MLTFLIRFLGILLIVTLSCFVIAYLCLVACAVTQIFFDTADPTKNIRKRKENSDEP